MLTVLLILVAVVATEAVVELVVKSKIFEPFRKAVAARSEGSRFFDFIRQVVSCGYCFSVWAAALVVMLTLLWHEPLLGFLPAPIKYLVLVLFIHRLSNYLHNVGDRIDKFYQKKS